MPASLWKIFNPSSAELNLEIFISFNGSLVLRVNFVTENNILKCQVMREECVLTNINKCSRA